MQPRELQRISRLTARADSLSDILSLLEVTLLILAALNCFKISPFFIFKNSDVQKSLLGFIDTLTRYVSMNGEHSAAESSLIRNNTSVILNSTELSGAMEREATAISSVVSPEPQTVTIDSDSNELTFAYEFGHQNPFVPPSLNDFNLPPNHFNVLATMARIRQDEADSPQSPEPSDPSPISTPPMNVSTIESWYSPQTTTDDNTFCSSENEPRRVYWDFSPRETFDSVEPRRVSFASSPSSTPPPLPRQNRKLSMGMSFPQKWEVSQHTCDACS